MMSRNTIIVIIVHVTLFAPNHTYMFVKPLRVHEVETQTPQQNNGTLEALRFWQNISWRLL
jgi:hypothetical protein